ncbi:relaxase domain-containing protein [Acidiferrimicrobium sp. IK]|uniref:MobF family relaxase n=1 Tax=Acidiferrimicrobium sp. IK TaxID=2871700 RepID=UPI0021CB00D2|nr:MobF family relaxase [Acidiferrimicrobium sp. IK]MCU4183842.1 relaxase domain-containing protein [Acidiferrimicrobium sp. IK]
MLTIRRLTAGTGYKYLISSIARGDGAADQSSPLTRYYEQSGTPPGRFAGGGLAALGLDHGQQVTDEHLYRMLMEVTNPATGDQLGRQRPPPLQSSLKERVEARLARLPAGEREAARADAEPAERRRTLRAPVAAFDLTFSPSKSVSAAWALADEGTKAVIYDCHMRAIAYTLAYAERNLLHSRSGKNGVVQEDIEGTIAAAFTHYDTRSGDPQLHDHVVVWNRAKSVSDGEWRTLDSRGLFKSVVTISEIHQGVLADMLTQALGVGWEPGSSRQGMRKHEMTGVPEALIREFSQRRDMIEEHRDRLESQFVAEHGREPSKVERMRLNQQANLATRQDKTHRSLADMSAEWRERAMDHIGVRPEAWVSTLRNRNDLPLLRADDLTDEMLSEVAELAVAWQAERRATFSRANIMAEAARQLEGLRCASPDDRMAIIERATDLALGEVVQVTAPELHHTPRRYQRQDGTSRLRPAGHHLYTTESLLDAEQRLLTAGRDITAATVPVAAVAAVVERNLPDKDYTMSTDQAVAVEKIATSGRQLDVLVGPAGTGKSTTMAGLRAAWESEHGHGSVVGLAPSASAAEVLGDELGIDTENTAKWLHEHRQTGKRGEQLAALQARIDAIPHDKPVPDELLEQARRLRDSISRWQLRPGQLVIVDEASLAGTFALDELTDAAGRAGAKVLLVGDPYQLSAVDAGGMFRTLARDRDDIAPELSDVRRFANGWEKTASVELRVGSEAAIDAYEKHDRIEEGDRETLLDALYKAWKQDVEDGKRSLMVAADSATVSDLNRRARSDRIAAGKVAEHGLAVADGQTAGVGDEVVTRQNDRRLATAKGFVKNGDRWTVTATNDDGSMVVQRAGGGGSVVLPAHYVAEHVELGYATTAHRAQGRTVDTAHAIISPTTTREVLYVAASRGRAGNWLYVDTAYDPDPPTSHDGVAEPQTAHEVLAGVLANEGVEQSATDTIRSSWDAAESIGQLSAEYLTLAREAQRERWDTLIEHAGLDEDHVEQVRGSAAYGPLVHAFTQAEARGIDPETVIPRLVAARDLTDTDDVAAVLHGRLDRYVEAAGSKRQATADLIAGLVPRAKGVTDPDMAKALHERDEAMERRAAALAERAVERKPPWVRRLGSPPDDPAARAAWIHQVRVVAAYRERWNLAGAAPVDERDRASSIEQIGHQKRAQAAAERALTISRQVRQQHRHREPEELTAAVEQSKGIEL